MPISKPHSSFGSQNKGSCARLVSYLDKENEAIEKEAINMESKKGKQELLERQRYFFDHKNEKVSQIIVIQSIDSNKFKLGKKDEKFFAPTISFSQKELQHIAKKASGRKVNTVDEMNNKEFKKYNELLREYGRKAMDNYAKNFNRQDKGLKDGNDLVYYGKIEHTRHYKGTDKAVKSGEAISGEKKPGLQSHIHFIVSRKDRAQRLKLHPATKEKRTDRSIGKNNYRVGFDRKEWISENEKTFDKTFGYQRNARERFKIQNSLKNGTAQEKKAAKELINKEKSNQISL